MSLVSDRMRARVLASGRADGVGVGVGVRVGAGVGDQTAPTLADLQRGQSARVVGYSIGVEPGAARRLFDLGLMPGIEVTMVRRAPLRDPVIFRVGDYEIALRRAQARVIQVDLQSDRPADLRADPQADLAH